MQEVNGNEYRVGCTHCVLYESSGISLDWAHGKVICYLDVYTDQLNTYLNRKVMITLLKINVFMIK